MENCDAFDYQAERGSITLEMSTCSLEPISNNMSKKRKFAMLESAVNTREETLTARLKTSKETVQDMRSYQKSVQASITTDSSLGPFWNEYTEEISKRCALLTK